MEKLIIPNEDRSFRRLMAAMATALLLFYMVCPVAPQRWNDLYSSYGKTLIIAMAAIYFYKCRFRGCIELKLVIVYTVWLFVSRLLNTDYYLQNELDLVISRLLCCVIFPVGMLLERSEREKLLDFVIAIVGAFYFITALLGLFACIFGVYFYIPPENVVFGIDNTFMYNAYAYMVAWESNRTIAAVWFYLSWCMMAYEFFHCKNKLWRIPICIAWFVFHLALAFSFCRSLMLAVCGNVVMLIILLGMEKLKSRKLRTRIALIALAAVLALPITYKSFEVLRSGSALIYNSLDTDIERTADEFMSQSFRDMTQDGQNFEDQRDLKTSISNISNRGEIYKSILPTFRDDPMRLLIGKYSDKIMDIPNQYQSYPYFHMHNFLLQTLMLTGVPGFLLVLAFTLMLVLRMLYYFFSGHSAANLASKVLTLPLAGIFVYGMFETILFTQSADNRALTDFRELCFFLLAGIFLGYYYEIFPTGNKNK